MTQEEKRIKLAQVGGWKVHPKDRFVVIPPNSPKSVQPLSTIPDFYTDLNAVHELEGVLTLGQYDTFCEHLGGSLFSCARASAAQRAEAIGLTLNLWKA